MDSPSLDPRQLELVDALCVEYRSERDTGETPDIEKFLDRVDAPARDRLLYELIREEVDVRRSRGRALDVDDLLRRFPEDRHVVSRALSEASPIGSSRGEPAAASSSGDSFVDADTVEQASGDDSVEVSFASGLADSSGKATPDSNRGSTRPLRTSDLPSRIGRYRVDDLLASGAFGCVVRAFDEELERPVAVKIPRSDRVAPPDVANAFTTEARIAASLRHPNIAQVFDFGQAEKLGCFIVSEFVSGTTLGEFVRKSRPSYELLTALLAKAADALHHAHLAGLVHRDVKPDNVLVDDDGEPRLVDFGIALREDEQEHRAGELAGTYSYMSPEQVRFEAHRLDGRTDVWSLGVILYEMLTGRLPFRASTELGLRNEILERSPKPPRMIRGDIPPALESICLRALEKDVDRRFRTAEDLAAALRDWEAAGNSARVATTAFAVPFQRNPRFVGRDWELDAVHALLSQDDSPPCGLVGMGGVGKTQLAVEYAFRHRADHPGGIFWVNAAGSLSHGFAGLASAVSRELVVPTDDEAIRFVSKYVLQHPRMLIVFDNVEDPSELFAPLAFDVIPAALPCHILFTTRQQLPDRLVAVQVEPVSTDDALDILLREDRRDVRERSHPDRPVALRICEILGRLPLALEIAANHLQRRSAATLEEYERELLRRGALPVMDDPRGAVRPEDLPTRHEAAVTATVSGQWDALDDAEAGLLFRIAGQLGDSAFVSLTRLGLLGGVDHDVEGFFGSPALAAVERLRDATLVEELREGADGVQLRLHPLVREFAARCTPPETTLRFRVECAERLVAAYESVGQVESQVSARGVDAVLEDLATAALLLDEDAESGLPETGEENALTRLKLQERITRIRVLGAILRQDSHVLRHWSRDDHPLWMARQLLYRAQAFEAFDLVESARSRLEDVDDVLSLRWRAGFELRSLDIVLHGHAKSVLTVEADRTGRRLVSGDADGTIRVWDVATGRTEHVLLGHRGVVRDLVLGPDSCSILSVADDETLCRWNLDTGNLEGAVTLEVRQPNAVALTRGGEIVVGGDDGVIEILDEDDLKSLEVVDSDASYRVVDLAVTADGRTLVVACTDGGLRVLDVESRRTLHRLQSDDSPVNHVAISSNGGLVAATHVNGRVAVWRLAEARLETIFDARTGSAWGVAFTSDGRFVVATYWSRRVLVWSIESGEVVRDLSGHDRAILDVCLTSDNKRIACASMDRTVKVWRLGGVEQPLQVLRNVDDAVRSLDGDGTPRSSVHTRSVTGVAMMPGHGIAVSCSHDATLRVSDLGSGRVVEVLDGIRDHAVNDVCVSSDESLLVASVDPGHIVVYEVESMSKRNVIDAHGRPIGPVAMLRSGYELVTTARGEGSRVWNLRSGGLVHEMDEEDDVSALAVSTTGRLLFVGDGTGAVHVRDTSDWNDLRSSRVLDEPVRNLVEVDGARLLVIGVEGTVTTLDWERGRILERWEIPRPSRACRGPNGRVVIACSDGGLRCIEPSKATHVELVVLDAPLTALACADRTLVAGDTSGTVYALDVLESG